MMKKHLTPKKKRTAMKTKVAIILVVTLLTLPSCFKSFLDPVPRGVITEEVFLTTEDDAILATNAIYSMLREWNYHSGGYPILEIMSDDARKGSNPTDQTGTVGSFDNFTFDASAGDISRWYTTLYKAIRRANIVINGIGSISMDESMKLRLTGEARFLRAMFYFDLVRAFGDVQIVTTINPEGKIPRSAASKAYDDIIIPDLIFAIDNLPEKSDYAAKDLGRATRGAAKSLLAKVYLFRGEYQKAFDYAMEVITIGQYDLEPVYSDIFAKGHEFGIESIFEIGAIASESFEGGGNQYANTQGVRGIPNKGWGFNRPSLDLIAAYDEGDPRLDATVIFLGETIDGILIKGDGSNPDTIWTDATKSNLLEIETYNQKVWVPGTTTLEEYDCNKKVIRYADVLLIAAEAGNEVGETVEALKRLNEVRKRAREGSTTILPDIEETDKDLLREIIMHERRVELAMEEQRFFDLIRTGKAATVLAPYGFQTGKNELLPIPQSEIDLSEGTLDQNPNWE
jgi:starch-binding outer membrane protein, SusD/RagB family